MSDTNWMEAEAYDLADKIYEKLTMAYKQGVNDAWTEADKKYARSVFEALPSAEPKTGKWIRDGYDFPHGNDWIHCSVCGKRGINVPADLTNFCPNCGSKMVREDGEA